MLFIYFVVFIFLAWAEGGGHQVMAAFQVLELVGTVEQKNRSPLPPPVQHEEPGNLADRSDRATSIVIDGSKMFITRDTVVKNIDGKYTDFDEVPVPCQARILLQELPNGARNVLELDIQSLVPGASKKWPDPLPQ